MTDEREIDTNLETALGMNPDAPWTDVRIILPPKFEKFKKMEWQDQNALVRAAAEASPDPHQGSEDPDVEEFVPTEAEKDAMARARELPRPAAKGVKRPRTPEPDEDGVPDLAEIFDNYDTPHSVRISVCRAYASYIASLQPKKPKAASKRKNKD